MCKISTHEIVTVSTEGNDRKVYRSPEEQQQIRQAILESRRVRAALFVPSAFGK